MVKFSNIFVTIDDWLAKWLPRLKQAFEFFVKTRGFILEAMELLKLIYKLITSKEFRVLAKACRDFVLSVKNFLVSVLGLGEEGVFRPANPSLLYWSSANLNTLGVVGLCRPLK